MAGTISLETDAIHELLDALVSMESGLDGRNNLIADMSKESYPKSLNGVRPRWPEQLNYIFRR